MKDYHHQLGVRKFRQDTAATRTPFARTCATTLHGSLWWTRPVASIIGATMAISHLLLMQSALATVAAKREAHGTAGKA